MPRKNKDFLGSLKKAIEDIGIPLEGLNITDIGLLASLIYTFYLFEKPYIDRALVQAFIDYALIKSGTEIGVGSSIAHITGRGILEYLPAEVTNIKDLIRSFARPSILEALNP